MNNNLPEVRREGIFTKIKNWFKNLFRVKNIEENLIPESIEEIKNSNFKDSIKVESKEKILFLQRKIKEKQMEIADLAEEELDEMIKLYETQVEEKERILKQYKDKLKAKKEE